MNFPTSTILAKRVPRTLTLILVVTLCFAAHPLRQALAQQATYQLKTTGGVVVSDSGLASQIGTTILDEGGNAVDAAVATAFALAVSWPEAGNIGGGGFMIVRPADGTNPICIDYRETAPLAAHETIFKSTDSTLTHKAVGVPGTVRGLALAHKKYGKLTWKQVVLPAAQLARGFMVSKPLAQSVNSVLASSKDNPIFKELRDVYGKPDGTEWKANDVMRLTDLANTLERIATAGPNAFYQGHYGTLLVNEISQGNGLIRQADLDAYQAKIRKPIIGTFNGFEIIGAPPPSSGGICVIQALNLFEALKLPNDDRFSPETMHLIAEVSRRVFLDRARHLGDPDFTTIPEHLTSKKYAQQLASQIDRTAASSSEQLAPEIKLAAESPNTTHFSVVDADGMAVSNTYTLEASWGSRIVVKNAGYVLNNEMGDFNWIPGYTNRSGRIGTSANLVQPGKRMLSSQCPVIVTKDGELTMVTGSPGGRTIINTVLGIVLNHTHFGMTGPESVAAPRFHHQWMPDQFVLEEFGGSKNRIDAKRLGEMGHKIVYRAVQGSAHTIVVDGKSKTGIADGRRSGRPKVTANWKK